MSNEKDRFPYAKRVLEDKIRLEAIQLGKMEANNTIPIEQKEKHISGYKHRILELDNAIKELTGNTPKSLTFNYPMKGSTHETA